MISDAMNDAVYAALCGCLGLSPSSAAAASLIQQA